MNDLRLFFLMLSMISVPVAGQKRAITFEDLWSMRRVKEMTVSPDGLWIAYTVTQYNIVQNKKESDIYIVGSNGGNSRQLTTHPASDSRPRWSPDGELLSFISERNGKPQIFVIPMTGGEAHQISNAPAGVADFIWSPDGKYIAFTSKIALSEDAESDNDNAIDTKARIIDKLPCRHWNRWLDGKRSHLFVMNVTRETVWDVTPGDYDTPPISLGSHQDFSFSPDSKEIAFVRNTDPNLATSTNNDIFLVSVKGGTIHQITRNLANDNQPIYSPDGKYIAYRAMRRSGFEADQYDLILYDRKNKTRRNLTSEFDLDIREIIWEPSSKAIIFTADDQGRIVIFRVEIKNQKIKGLLLTGCNTEVGVTQDENFIYFRRTQINLPHEIFRCDWKGDDLLQLTFMNNTQLNMLEMNAVNDFWIPSIDNKILHGMIVKPPFFDPAKQYPGVLLIHGGPQSAWKDEFHYRWNAQLFASRGYVVIMLNIRGSKGYGQSYSDAVTGNWGGTPYRELMTGLDNVLKKYPFIDPERISAAGASYGGYMINWIAGHTDRFRCLVSHDGISNPVSFYGVTEELWFPEWEFGGTPYENAKSYEKWSPLKYVKDFKTPTLVIHGEKDYRVGIDQGLQMFTALQRQKIPSRLLYFPDEGHFVTQPQNARIWWQTVLDWIDKWTNNPESN